MKWCRADHSLDVSLHSGVRMPHCWCVYLSLKFWGVIILSLNIFLSSHWTAFLIPEILNWRRVLRINRASWDPQRCVVGGKVHRGLTPWVSDIIREPLGWSKLQQWRWSLSKSFSCTEQLNKWLCHSLAHRSSDWMKSYKTYREQHWTTFTIPCNVFDYGAILC